MQGKSINLNITLSFLKHCPGHIPLLASWMLKTWGQYNPTVTFEKAQQKLIEHLNEKKLPLTVVAMQNGKPIGMCSLRAYEGLQSELSPWLGSLYVDPIFRELGIGEHLIHVIKKKAHSMGYSKIYLISFESNLTEWYHKLGWEVIGTDDYNGHPVEIMMIDIY